MSRDEGSAARVPKVAFGVILIVAAGLLYTILQKPFSPTTRPEPVLDINKARGVGNEDLAATEEEEVAKLEELFFAEPVEGRRSWELEHGYYRELPSGPGIVYPSHSYESLTTDSLEDLVDANDALAAAVLADRFVGSLDPAVVQKGLDLHKRAVALGSSYSANIIGSHYISKNIASDDPSSTVERFTEGLAWFLVAADAGDPGNRMAFYLQVRDRDVSAEGFAAVCARAEEIAGEIDAVRNSVGLKPRKVDPMPGFEDLSGTPRKFSDPCSLM
ncbi:MAG: hypothetical protein QNJ00_00355 [Woeseiaceae bacterium]|nr:hypothetical protein [Woeseiaceae bacterium]